MCRSSNYTTFCKQNVSSADRFQHNPKVMRLLISSRHCPNKVFHRSSELLCPVKFMTISIPVLPLFRNPLRPQQFWAGKLFNVPNHAIIIPLGYMLYSKTRIIHSSFSPLIFFCSYFHRVRCANDGPTGNAHRGRQERPVWPVALASVGPADVLLWLLQHTPVRRGRHQRQLDRHGRSLCR